MDTKTLDQRIEIRPEVLGGKPCIAGRRIAVEHIVIWHERLGLSADEIASEYDLELSDVYAALAYYFAHRDEIDGSLRDGRVFAEKLREMTPSLLEEKLGRNKETEGAPRFGIVYAPQDRSIGEMVRMLDLLAQVSDAEEMQRRIEFIGTYKGIAGRGE